MSEITLEKVDLVKDRTGVSYTEAKEALEASEGNVVDVLVFIENKKKNKGVFYQTKEEFINWIKDIINKGNVTRIKIKKEDNVLVDLPVNAGIAVTGLTALLSAPLLAIGVVSAVVTKVTVEITKEDGSVEVVNKYIKNTMGDVKDKFGNLSEKLGGVAEEVKGVISDMAEDIKGKMKSKENNMKQDNSSEENVYKYTVDFEEVDEKNEEESDKES
ncbi:MAG TPA: ubiquitin [Clostridium sp.]|nr:ubiquitin [Clostridium sp.]